MRLLTRSLVHAHSPVLTHSPAHPRSLTPLAPPPSVVPVVTRVLKEDDELLGYKIPAGSMITVLVQHIHNQYKDPRAYKPERFMPGGEYDQFDEGVRPYMFLPFIQVGWGVVRRRGGVEGLGWGCRTLPSMQALLAGRMARATWMASVPVTCCLADCRGAVCLHVCTPSLTWPSSILTHTTSQHPTGPAQLPRPAFGAAGSARGALTFGQALPLHPHECGGCAAPPNRHPCR